MSNIAWKQHTFGALIVIMANHMYFSWRINYSCNMSTSFLGMGIDAHRRTGAEKTIALQYDAEGKLRHDAVARIGHAKDKVGHLASATFFGNGVTLGPDMMFTA